MIYILSMFKNVSFINFSFYDIHVVISIHCTFHIGLSPAFWSTTILFNVISN